MSAFPVCPERSVRGPPSTGLPAGRSRDEPLEPTSMCLWEEGMNSMRLLGSRAPIFEALLALLLAVYPSVAAAGMATNPVCPVEAVQYNPGNGEDIIVPSGYTVSVFAKDLNFPTAVAFVGSSNRFKVYVLESGHGLPSRCNDENNPIFGGVTSAKNPMTPDILVFD